MANKKYRIKLSVEERKELEALIAAGKAAVSKRHRAQILLCADEGHEQGAMKDADTSVPWSGRLGFRVILIPADK